MRVRERGNLYLWFFKAKDTTTVLLAGLKFTTFGYKADTVSTTEEVGVGVDGYGVDGGRGSLT